jgi:hypothetical protein
MIRTNRGNMETHKTSRSFLGGTPDMTRLLIVGAGRWCTGCPQEHTRHHYTHI